MTNLILLLIMTVLMLSMIPKHLIQIIRKVSYLSSSLVAMYTCYLWFQHSGVLLLVSPISDVAMFILHNQDFYDIVAHFVWQVINADGLSLIFIILTSFIIPLCILAGKNLPFQKNFLITLFIIELLLFLTFSSTHLILFYVCFEAILLPMFYLVIVWGSRSRKIKAAYYLFLYTVFGAIFFFLSYALLLAEYNWFDFNISFIYYIKLLQFNEKLGYLNFEFFRQLVIWFGFFITFAIKIPIFPFHIWLPEAHVEAPTVGSVILASLLLKIGGYGMIKFLVIFERATKYMQPFIYTVCLISILYASLAALRQLDIKKIIAYSSIAHMNFVVLAIFSLTFDGLYGSIILMLGHGIVSGALFLLIGVLYERYHTRNVLYYGGLTQTMPLISALFFFFSISNFSFPGTANFVGEILILKAVLQTNFFITILLLISSVLTVGYSMFLYNRIFFGNLKISFIETFFDLTRQEFSYLLPLVIANLFLGVYPNTFLVAMQNTLYMYINYPVI